MNTPAAIVGVGTSAIERRSDRGIVAFALDAARAAIADAGLDLDDIDGYVGAPTATNAGGLRADGADEVSMRLLAQSLGLDELRWGADLAGAFAPDMVASAAHALAAGAARRVLGVRALYHLPERDYAAVRTTHAYGGAQWTAPYGFTTAGARFAARARAYLEATGATREDLYAVPALARQNAARNPVAIWRERQLSCQEYLSARLIADPLGLHDCDMPVCGAAAFVMTAGDLATAGPQPPAYVRGWTGWRQPPSSIFGHSGLSRERIDVCQLYDGFSTMVWDTLEALEFCEPGTAWRWVRDGKSAPDGPLPINTFGGSLGEGRMHGMGHLREAVLQVTGRADARQVPGARSCLVQVGTFDFSSLLVLGADPGPST